MAGQSRLKSIYQRIEGSIEGERWQEARSGLREIARLLVDATIVADNDLVAQIDELVAQIFLDVSLDDTFQVELSLNSIGWSADGLRDVSQLARRRRPPMTSEQRAATLKDAEARVLAFLGEGNAGPKSNREIADKLDLHVATVARTLGALRASGKVRSWPEGRFMMNMLAEQTPAASPDSVSNTLSGVEGLVQLVDDAKVDIEKNDPLDLLSIGGSQIKVDLVYKNGDFGESLLEKGDILNAGLYKDMITLIKSSKSHVNDEFLQADDGTEFPLVAEIRKDNLAIAFGQPWRNRDLGELDRAFVK